MQFQYETEIEFNDEYCLATINLEVTHYEDVKGSYSYNSESDMDYLGYTELDYLVKSIEIETEDKSVFIKSEETIKDIIPASMYPKIYDWLLDQMRNDF